MVERLRDTAETVSQITARLSGETRRLTAENRLLRKRLNSVQRGRKMSDDGKHTPGPWQIGMGARADDTVRYNANQICTEGSSAGTSTSICSVYGIWDHATLAEIEEDAKTIGRCKKGLANARLIAAAPEMYDVLVRIVNKPSAIWISDVAEALLAKIDGDIKERQRAKHYEDVTCDKSGCDGDRAEAHHTFAGGTTYKCAKCGHIWEEPCY